MWTLERETSNRRDELCEFDGYRPRENRLDSFPFAFRALVQRRHDGPPDWRNTAIEVRHAIGIVWPGLSTFGSMSLVRLGCASTEQPEHVRAAILTLIEASGKTPCHEMRWMYLALVRVSAITRCREASGAGHDSHTRDTPPAPP